MRCGACGQCPINNVIVAQTTLSTTSESINSFGHGKSSRAPSYAESACNCEKYLRKAVMTPIKSIWPCLCQNNVTSLWSSNYYSEKHLTFIWLTLDSTYPCSWSCTESTWDQNKEIITRFVRSCKSFSIVQHSASINHTDFNPSGDLWIRILILQFIDWGFASQPVLVVRTSHQCPLQIRN